MKNLISPAEETVGLMLAKGFTKKEVANQLHKSIRTVERQSDMLYKKTNSRNLADITRFMIRRYTGIAVEDILIHAMHDITILAALCLTFWAADTLGALDEMKAAISNVATSTLSTVANFLTK
jgi:DNA-binding CsgD family transcriptional regulator